MMIETMENSLLEEQTREIAELKKQLQEKDNENKELRDTLIMVVKERDRWMEKYKNVVKLKNEIQTDKFVRRSLTEFDLEVTKTGMYDALKWDLRENNPGKRVQFTRIGLSREGMVRLKENITPPVPAPKKVREGSPVTPTPPNTWKTRVHNILDKYFTKSSLPIKQKKKEKLNVSSYKTEGGFLTPEDKTHFLQLEGGLNESDNTPIVGVFKEVLTKLRGVTIVFGVT